MRSGIRSLADVFGVDAPEWKPQAIICDIDGTVAAHPHRGHYEYNLVDTDEPHQDVIDLVQTIAEFMHTKLIFVSGRMDDPQRDVRQKTVDWLNEYFTLWDLLFMRANGDFRPDDIVKRELYEKHIEPNFEVIGVFDDRDRVVKMWRELGLRVYQVAPGDF